MYVKWLMLLLLPFLGPAQAQKDSLVVYSEIVEADSCSQERLFRAADRWMPFETKDFKIDSVITDSAYGHLSGRGFCVGVLDRKDTKEFFNTRASYRFSIDIWVVDGKYKYLISDIYDELGFLLTSSPTSPAKYPLSSQKASDRFWQADKNAFGRKIQEQIASLKSWMARAKE